MTEEEKE